MIRTVDLVVAGTGDGALAAAVAALRRGQRVFVVLRSSDARVAHRVRRRLREAVGVNASQVSVTTGYEVVCVDGVEGVEVVVIRHGRTGRLRAVNTCAFVADDGPPTPGRADEPV